jgi:antitoxin VapB
MGVFIKKPEAEAKIRELAERTGESITDAIERAVEERLQRLGPKEKKKGRIDRKRLAELLAYFDSLPKINEHLTDEEIIGYDEHGLPK